MKKLSAALLLLLLFANARAAVVFEQAITPWQSVNPTTSGSFTPNASGDYLVVWGTNGTTSSATLSFSGTGTYSVLSPPGDVDDTLNGNTFAIGLNSSATASSQTATVTVGGGDQGWGWLFDYSGASSASAAGVLRDAPGTGSGAIEGTAVTVPSGGILVAFCTDTSGGTDTISSPSGITRQNGNNNNAEYQITEYAGSGSSITPTFTSADGGSDEFVVMQVVLSSSGGGSCTHDGWTQAGAWAVPTSGSTVVWLQSGAWGTVNCSSTSYYQQSGAFGVN